jgi:predicted amidohydrolase YtcJ
MILLQKVRLGTQGSVADVLIRDHSVVEIAPDIAVKGVELVVTGEDLTVLPGLKDAHVHATQWALSQNRIDVSSCRSPGEVVARIVSELQRQPRPADELVTAYGFRDSGWNEQPHGGLLEDALPGRRVLVISNDLHTAWVSPAAAKGLHGALPATGVVREAEALRIMDSLPDVADERSDAWVRECLARASARGVTSLVDFEVADNLTEWSRRCDLESLPVRITATVYPDHLKSAMSAGYRTGDILPGTDGLVQVGPLKIFVDGSLNTRTALCHAPYLGGDDDDRGVLVTGFEELRAMMHDAQDAGFECAVHVIGDHAAAIALKAFDDVGCTGRIEHAQLLSTGDIAFAAALGLVVGIQPMHALDDREVAERLWGDRLAAAFPHGSLARAGVPVEIGSDAPVSPLDPWLGIAAATWRTLGSDVPWCPDERMSLDEALAAAAGGRRSVRAGDVADLVVVRGRPQHMAPHELAAVEVEATFLAGRPTWLASL